MVDYCVLDRILRYLRYFQGENGAQSWEFRNAADCYRCRCFRLLNQPMQTVYEYNLRFFKCLFKFSVSVFWYHPDHHSYCFFYPYWLCPSRTSGFYCKTHRISFKLSKICRFLNLCAFRFCLSKKMRTSTLQSRHSAMHLHCACRILLFHLRSGDHCGRTLALRIFSLWLPFGICCVHVVRTQVDSS